MAIDNMAIVYALAALLLGGISELIYRVAHQGEMHESSYMLVQTGTVFLTLLLLSGGGIGFDISPEMIGLGMISGDRKSVV